MKANQDRLLRHLAIAVALKLVVLLVLWWAFVRDERAVIDAERAAAHLTPPTPAGAQP